MTLPADDNPIARLIQVLKYCETTAGAGKYRHPNPMPIKMPWVRNICQNLVHMLVRNIPRIVKVDPIQSKELRYPASKRGPVTTETRNMRNACVDPIQEMLDADSDFRSSS